MLDDSKLATVCRSSVGIERARVGRELRRGVGAGWRLVTGFGYAEVGIVILRGIVRQLMLQTLSCRIVELWNAW
jgi:hypothetical protein